MPQRPVASNEIASLAMQLGVRGDHQGDGWRAGSYRYVLALFSLALPLARAVRPVHDDALLDRTAPARTAERSSSYGIRHVSSVSVLAGPLRRGDFRRGIRAD